MKTLFYLFLANVLPLISNGQIQNEQTNNPFLNLKIDKVIFYDFEENSQKGSLIVDNKNKPLQTIIKQVQISQVEIRKFNIRVNEKKSYGHRAAACFDPHCGFVYFLNGKPVAQITICLECNRLRSDIDIPAQKQGKQGRGKNAYYILDGLSKSFRQFINNLLKKYNFSHQIKPDSMFDK